MRDVNSSLRDLAKNKQLGQREKLRTSLDTTQDMLSAREDADTEHFYDLSEAGLDPVWSLNHGKFTGYYTAFFTAAESTMEEVCNQGPPNWGSGL